MTLLGSLLAFLAGAGVVLTTLDSAIRTFILPRSQNVRLTRWVFISMNRVFNAISRFIRTETQIEGLWAMYAPISLIVLPFIWLVLIGLGFMLMFWSAGVRPLGEAFVVSGSSLLTLGFAPVTGAWQTTLAFAEAALGLVMVALLIAYLPTMYAAFSRRESLVAKLEVYAGFKPSPVEIIARMHRINGIDYLRELFTLWETWFAEIEEAHTSLAPLNFFRSPKPHRSWVTAAGAVLDAAALTLSCLDLPREPRAALCIRSGYLALRHISDFFGFAYNPSPGPNDPILVTREEFEAALDYLAETGVKLKPDRDQAWRDFSGWRVNYDEVLVALAFMTRAPAGVWSSDRLASAPKRLKQPADFKPD